MFVLQPGEFAFNLNVTTRTGRKLPDDVAAIIFKKLQDKTSSDVSPKPANLILRKPRTGEYKLL